MNMEQLRHKVNVTFTDDNNKECPMCHNVVEIDLKNQGDINQFLGLMKYYNDSQAEKINKYQFFITIRACFWSLFAMMVALTCMTYFIEDYFNIFALFTFQFGICYIIMAIIYFIRKRLEAKKSLQNEIESMMKVEESKDS